MFVSSLMGNSLHVLKIWVQILIKQHACRELLSFWLLKIPFIKKNVEHSQAKRGENLFQDVNFVKNIYEGSIIL